MWWLTANDDIIEASRKDMLTSSRTYSSPRFSSVKLPLAG
uniref:Uncharacterized protein n=1 Tax=Arundo donax TaxID=35708 RepID=A0A0A8YJB1_ARUDO